MYLLNIILEVVSWMLTSSFELYHHPTFTFYNMSTVREKLSTRKLLLILFHFSSFFFVQQNNRAIIHLCHEHATSQCVTRNAAMWYDRVIVCCSVLVGRRTNFHMLPKSLNCGKIRKTVNFYSPLQLIDCNNSMWKTNLTYILCLLFFRWNDDVIILVLSSRAYRARTSTCWCGRRSFCITS